MEDIEKRRERQRRYERGTRKANYKAISIRVPAIYDHPDLGFMANLLFLTAMEHAENSGAKTGDPKKTLFQVLAKVAAMYATGEDKQQLLNMAISNGRGGDVK